jgi:hypothetical protein
VYRTCPKCGHTRAANDTSPAGECAGCGLVFAKWLKSRFRSESAALPDAAAAGAPRTGAGLAAAALHVEQPVNQLVFGGRALVWLALVVWSGWFFGTDYRAVELGSTEIGNSFMHRVNLVFHEAGHVLFMPFGEFLAVLGGSLGQLLMPLVVAVAFVARHRNPFGGSVGLWWVGQSAMDLAPYVADARAGRLTLLGGFTGQDRPGYHDWERLLGTLGWMHHDLGLAAAINAAGMALMALALGWGGWLLWRQHRHLDRRF